MAFVAGYSVRLLRRKNQISKYKKGTERISICALYIIYDLYTAA